MRFHHYPEEKPNSTDILLIRSRVEPVWCVACLKTDEHGNSKLEEFHTKYLLNCRKFEWIPVKELLNEDSIYSDSNNYIVESIQKNDSGEYIATVRAKPITKKLRLTEERAGGAFHAMRSNIGFNFKISEVIEE